MTRTNFYSLFGADQLQYERVDELLVHWPHHRTKPTDKAVDTAISNRLIAYLSHPELSDKATRASALEVNFVLALDAFNESLINEAGNKSSAGTEALHSYLLAYAGDENITKKIIYSKSIRTILANFGTQPATTGEQDYKIPMMWNAYVLLVSFMLSFYRNGELDLLELKTREPGWSEASLQNLAEQPAINKLFHAKRKTLARAVGDASDYFAFASIVCGTIMTIRALKYPKLSLKECSQEMEITLEDMRNNIEKILISSAWFEKQLMHLWIEPSIDVRAKRDGGIVETKKVKSQTLSKLMNNNGYASIMPLTSWMRFKLPWDGMEGPEQLLKDFAFIKGTKEGDSVVGGVDVGRRSTLSRVRKAFIKSK